MSAMIKLANGKEVTVDEFYRWSVRKQQLSLIPKSEETRKKMAVGGKFAWERRRIEGTASQSEETKAKISAALLGKKLGPKSAEQISKLSKSMLRISAAKKSAGIVTTISDEHRAAISASKKAYWEAKRASSPPKPKPLPKPKT